jgi:hypothetical protein
MPRWPPEALAKEPAAVFVVRFIGWIMVVPGAVDRRDCGEEHQSRVRASAQCAPAAMRREALSLTELDLDPRCGSVLVRRGKGGRRREIGMHVWGFEHVEPWLEACQKMRVAHSSAYSMAAPADAPGPPAPPALLAPGSLAQIIARAITARSHRPVLR